MEVTENPVVILTQLQHCSLVDHLVQACNQACMGSRTLQTSQSWRKDESSNVLDDNLLQRAFDLRLGLTFISQQDNDYNHTAKISKEWLYSWISLSGPARAQTFTPLNTPRDLKMAVEWSSPSNLMERFSKEKWEKLLKFVAIYSKGLRLQFLPKVLQKSIEQIRKNVCKCYIFNKFARILKQTVFTLSIWDTVCRIVRWKWI